MYIKSLVITFLCLGFITLNCQARVTKLQKPADAEETDIDKQEQRTTPEQKPIRKKPAAPARKFTARTNAIPQEFDIEAKRHEVEQLVSKAEVAFEKSKTLEEILNKITNEPTYQKGEIYVFIYDFDCVRMASGQDTELIWQNFYNYRDQFGTPVIRQLVESAKKGGGWVTYEWRGAIKVSLVKKVEKFGKQYVLGAGYWPFSKQDNVVSLVKGAVALFNQCVEENRPISEAFAEFGYPKGRFILGDLYIYALVMNGPRKGEHVAHGERPGLIGVNEWNYRDANGKFVNREIAEKLHAAAEGGIWIDYVSKGAPKKAYAEKVVDKKGTEYFIACGYYPDANRQAVVDLVDKGYAFMKAHGISEAAAEFNDLDNPDYRYGDLYLFVFDTKGKCFAEGGNPQLAKSNMFDEKDEDGRFWVREIIEKAKEGGGWIDFKFKNSFKSVYVELVDMGIEKLVIGSGIYPTTKMETMTLIAKSAAGLLKTVKETKEAFAEFVKPEGSKFIRGDLSVFVFERNGICFAYGNMPLIWKNLSYMKDAQGKSIVSLFDEVVEKGPSKVMYTINNNNTIAYVESLERDGTTYIIGSSFIQ